MNNRILTKNNLHKRGWQGDLACQFCHKNETITHLFLKCSVAKQIWFWMGRCQDYFYHWKTCLNIFDFAGSLDKDNRIALLVVFSVLVWTLWKHRNALIFQDTPLKPIRSLILLIISLVEYWAGHMDKRIKTAAANWLPTDIHAIPLRVWDPTEHQEVSYQVDSVASPLRIAADDVDGAQMGITCVAGSPASYI
jgi:hypothetical protein